MSEPHWLDDVFIPPPSAAVAQAEAPEAWEPWLRCMFPRSFGSFAPRHRVFWEWVWGIELDSSPDPEIDIWPRGGGKTSSAETATVALGLRGKRRYALYVRDTQDRAA